MEKSPVSNLTSLSDDDLFRLYEHYRWMSSVKADRRSPDHRRFMQTYMELERRKCKLPIDKP